MNESRRERASTEPNVEDANKLSQDTADSADRAEPRRYLSAHEVAPDAVDERGGAIRPTAPVEPGPDASAPDRDRTDIHDPGEQPKELRS